MKKVKVTKKIWFAMILIALFVAVFGLSASAKTYSGTCGAQGGTLRWSLDDSSGNMIITGTGDMISGSYIGTFFPWSEYRDAIRSVYIQGSVTSIGAKAFSDCPNLSKVTISSTTLEEIGEDAFANCTALSSVVISNLANWCNIKFDGYYANPLFYANNLYQGSKLVTKLVIPATVKEISDYAFVKCQSITSLETSNGVTSIGMASFYGCSNLTTATLSDSTTNIGKSAFSGCSKLTSINIPNGVTSIGFGTFMDCESLVSITLPYGVTSIGEEAFSYCMSLKDVYLPNSVTQIGDYAFWACETLAAISLPNSIKKIGEFAFKECKALAAVTIPNGVTIVEKVCSPIVRLLLESPFLSRWCALKNGRSTIALAFPKSPFFPEM